MTLIVDSSVWIDYFNGVLSPQTDILHSTLGNQPLGIGDIVLTEVLQGFKNEEDFAKAKELLEAFPVLDMWGEKVAMDAATNYRILRKKGITIRKTIDMVIASFCIRYQLPLLYSDRDFDPIVEHLGLIPFYTVH